jgi:hypothetical protein
MSRTRIGQGFQHRDRVDRQAGEQVGVGLCDAAWCLEQAFACGVVADRGQQLVHSRLDAFPIHGRAGAVRLFGERFGRGDDDARIPGHGDSLGRSAT